MKELLKRAAGLLGFEVRRILPPPLPPLVEPSITVLEADLLKEFATRAAQFSSEAETSTIRRLYLTGILGPEPPHAKPRIPIGGRKTSDIGVWRRETDAQDSAFVRRRDSGSDSPLWASKARIEPKRSKWRVAFLGESVARGYLYDPQFNPAAALETILRSELGAAQLDVVDLAKSNLSIDQLRTLIGQCLALQPDVIVIFAGNNWRPQLMEPDIPYVDTLLRQEGLPAMKSFLDDRTEQAVRLLIRQVNDLLARQASVSVIWVIPEFNLEDWHDPIAPAPHLPGRSNTRWRELENQAQRAFKDGDFGLAERLSLQMTKLDGGTSSVPLRMLAECRQSAKDGDGARRYLEMSRDAEGWEPSFQHSPRISARIQAALREAGGAPRTRVVDLPRIFEQHLDHGLPNRRIFLDYCHLTAEGIDVAMAAVASEILATLTGRTVPSRNLRGKASAPSPEVEGKASFLAAVHNAHFYQSYEVVLYWCARALASWPECAEIMTRYMDAETRRAPLLACKSTLDLLNIDKLDLARHLVSGRRPRLDVILGDAIAHALDNNGGAFASTLANLRILELSTRSGPKELTDFYYSAAVPGKWPRSWNSIALPGNRGSHAIFASAFWETSKFVFIGERHGPVGLKFTYRIPFPSLSPGIIDISINGQRIAQTSATREWQTFEMSVLGKVIADGINEIDIVWPTGESGAEEMPNRVADALVARQLPRLHRIFGEVHSLLVFDPVGLDRNSADLAGHDTSADFARAAEG